MTHKPQNHVARILAESYARRGLQRPPPIVEVLAKPARDARMTDHLVRDLRNIIQADKTISQTLRAFAMVLNDFSNAREADGEDSDCELLDEEAERLRDLADKFSC